MTGARLAIPSDYERLRRRDEHKRLLEEAAAPHEHVLLATALGVMARVRLVDREPEEPERVRRQVDVHRDPAPQVAEVFAQKPHLPAVVELVEEGLRVGDERARLDGLLRVDRGGEIGWAEVGVHDPVDAAADLHPRRR